MNIDPDLARRIEEVQRQLEQSIRPLMENLESVMNAINWPTVEAIQRFQQNIQNVFPGNVSAGQLHDVAVLAAKDGIGYPWALPTEIVDEMLDAEDADARRSLLMTSSSEIIEHCRTALSDRSGHLVYLADEVINLYQEGRLAASQSLAANIVDSWFSSEEPNGGKKRDRIGKAVEWTSDEQLVVTAILHAVLAPLKQTWAVWHRGDGPLENFSRHQTAHHISGDNTVTDLKAMQAVTLATSMACHHSVIIAANPSP